MTRVVKRRPRRIEVTPPKPPEKRRISSYLLLDDRGELIIDHAGKEYQLRETRNGKLILN